MNSKHALRTNEPTEPDRRQTEAGTDYIKQPPADGFEVYLDITCSALKLVLQHNRLRYRVLRAFSKFQMLIYIGDYQEKLQDLIDNTRKFNEDDEGRQANRSRDEETKFVNWLLQELEQIRSGLPDSDITRLVRRNAQIIGDTFKLPKHERELMFHIGVAQSTMMSGEMLNDLFSIVEVRETLFRDLLGGDHSQTSNLLVGNSLSERSGLLHTNTDFTYFAGYFSLKEQIKQCLVSETLTPETIRDSLLVKSPEATITMDDVPHMAEKLDLVIRMLKGAIATGKRNVSILLYGPPGTGKTELSRLVLSAAGYDAYEVGIAEYGGDLCREERFSDLLLAHTLLAADAHSGCVFDEMEDIMDRKVGEGSKIILNRLLDEGQAVTIFIANNLDCLPDYVLRRMTLALEVPIPPRDVQQNILTNMAKDAGVDITPEHVSNLIDTARLIPAVAKSAVHAAQLSGGHAKDLEFSYLNLNSALQGRKLTMKKSVLDPLYNPEFSETSTPLNTYADRLRGRGIKKATFLFYGLPGTGKSAGARYIAKSMGIKVVEKRASDLLGAYVGESEKRIRNAFEQAQDEKAALIFDEIDSLITDRTSHDKGWETSQVNEFLRALESQETPVFGCTNLRNNMDRAAMRRFLFHVEFRALPEHKAAACFRHYMSMEPPRDLQEIDGLVPAHFELLKKRCDVLEITDAEEMISMLKEDIVAQPDFGPIGFRPTTRVK
jgi:SpoVK/Ycf46/Vps4 family AAA+-type ATPase